MSVKHGLLAILATGDDYGYRLRGEFDRRTGPATSLNVGQAYATLDRLERDGLVERADVDAHGHVFYRITADGRAALDRWWVSPVTASAGRDELSSKISLAASLAGVDALGVIAVQRAWALDAVQRLDEELAGLETTPEGDVAWIGLEARRSRGVAELAWLDATAGRLAARDAHFPSGTDMPRRGRPANRTTASALASGNQPADASRLITP
ncbi:MAG TPA: PadR family transcriptional regulator [Plantibacter sp.]|uniref:PadR family transcriptional regulator n=1 Tax=unclassified Plantibacter TaxID=2624265 RepID=UPI002D1454F1|nr:PadR family transcriptional regulator [Plantibacter sp.]